VGLWKTNNLKCLLEQNKNFYVVVLENVERRMLRECLPDSKDK